MIDWIVVGLGDLDGGLVLGMSFGLVGVVGECYEYVCDGEVFVVVEVVDCFDFECGG